MISLLLCAAAVLACPAEDVAPVALARIEAPVSDSTVRPGERVFRITTTGAAVKLALPPFDVDPTVTKALKRRFGDRGLAQGRLRGGDGALNLVAAYGDVRSSASWRQTLMAQQLVGAGQFDVGRVACTETTRDLEPPYVDVSWHAFLVAGDTCFDATFSTMQKAGVAPFTRAEFESSVRSARLAFVRLGEWQQMPVAVLDRMHEALTAENAPSVDHLVELSATAPDAWACALAAAEIGLSTGRPADERLRLADLVLAGLAKDEVATPEERFARTTALSARALALRDAGRLDDALAALDAFEVRAKDAGPWALAALPYHRATVHGKKGDAAKAVEELKLAIAADPDRRSFAAHELCFESIRNDKGLLALLRAPPRGPHSEIATVVPSSARWNRRSTSRCSMRTQPCDAPFWIQSEAGAPVYPWKPMPARSMPTGSSAIQ